MGAAPIRLMDYIRAAFIRGRRLFEGASIPGNTVYSAGHQESRKCIFHSMYILSVILHAIDKQDISK